MKLHEVIPWGRSFEEYRRMFALTGEDLAGRILGCGDGPASFNAEATALGHRVVSCDPLYAFPGTEIERRVAECYETVISQVKKDRDGFVWEHFRDPGHLGECRRAAVRRFLADFEAGKREGRYVAASLPRLPFADSQFCLAVVSQARFAGGVAAGGHPTAVRSYKRERMTMLVFAAGPQAEVHWAWMLIGLLSVPALVALNGFFVAAEFALVAVRKTRVEEMVDQGVLRAKSVLEAVTHLDRYIAATQLGITLASIALGWLGEPALASLVDPLCRAVLPEAWVEPAAHTVAVAIAFTLITFMHVVFGELIPKTLALQSPDRTSLWVATPLVVFARLAWPFIAAMNGTGNAILRWAGYQPAGTEALVHSIEELALLIEDTQEAGILSPQQAEFVRKVFTLSGKRVGDCLVPRERMAALELSTPPDRILEVVRQGAHTRMPVYEGELDRIVGIVNTKDLFYLFSLKGVVVLEDALYPPLFLKLEDNVADALELFRRERRPLEPGNHYLNLV